MPCPNPPEFRRRAVELAREHHKPVAELAADLGISESCLRNWMARADVEEGRRDSTTTAERTELVERPPEGPSHRPAEALGAGVWYLHTRRFTPCQAVRPSAQPFR